MSCRIPPALLQGLRTSCHTHVFEVMDLQDLLAAVPAAEGLCPGQRVDLHHNLLLLAVAEERVFHVINLGGQSHPGSAQHPSGSTGWCWGCEHHCHGAGCLPRATAITRTARVGQLPGRTEFLNPQVPFSFLPALLLPHFIPGLFAPSPCPQLTRSILSSPAYSLHLCAFCLS